MKSLCKLKDLTVYLLKIMHATVIRVRMVLHVRPLDQVLHTFAYARNFTRELIVKHVY
jgi:hypothetical protein